MIGFEAAELASAVAAAADRALAPPVPWAPGAVQDDASPALAAALDGIGWAELGADPALAPLVAPAAAELGRRLAPLAAIDVLLGASPLAGGLSATARAPRSTPRARGTSSSTRSRSPTATRSGCTACAPLARTAARPRPRWRPGPRRARATWPG